ncbi:MAG: beta-lactamase family protein [Anaerolineae bacterium]|nr:beta-lactamase family protein [Anaerolineae bacterium]
MLLSEASSVSAPYEALERHVRLQMRRFNIPGAALVVVEGDRIALAQGYGSAGNGSGPPTPQTPFPIGSITKSFTALAIMQLVEAGRVDLDAPARRYLPWFRMADETLSDRITVRHLLNQTSGIPVGPGWAALADFDDSAGATERQARRLASVPLNHAPGAAFEYSNANFNLLGLIVEAAGGQPYSGYAQDRIFAPLGMTRSHTTRAAARGDGIALGHTQWFGRAIPWRGPAEARGSLPSGQLIASAEDMGRYIIALLNRGRCGDAQILSPEGIAQLIRPAADASAFGATQSYGMGWYISEHQGVEVVWHSGLVPDFYAYVALLPAQRRGFALLLNVDHFIMQPLVVEAGLGAAALLADVPPPPARMAALRWLPRALPIIPFLQAASVIGTVRLLARWRVEPSTRPAGALGQGLRILPPLAPDLALIALAAWLLRTPLRGFIRLFAPDFHAVALGSGTFAALWAAARTALLLVALRRPRP